MLKIPTVYIVKLVQVYIIAGHNSHGCDCGDTCSKQDYVSNLHLRGETAHETALELVIVALSLPSPGVTWPDESNPVL